MLNLFEIVVNAIPIYMMAFIAFWKFKAEAASAVAQKSEAQSAENLRNTTATNILNANAEPRILSIFRYCLWLFSGIVLCYYCLMPAQDINTKQLALIVLSGAWFTIGTVKK